MTRTMLPGLALALLLAGANAAPAQDFTVGSLTMSNLWTVKTAENAKEAPGYLTITNAGSTPDRLTGGSFANSQHVEVHAMTGNKMQRSGGLVINPGESVTLKPGSNHLMFIQLRSALLPGETEQAVLQFEKAGAKTVEFEVRSAAPNAKSAGKRPQTKAN